MTLRRDPLLLGALAVVLAVMLTGATLGLEDRATGAEAERCARLTADSLARERAVTGRGARVAVLGDSYAAGLGLADPGRSWPAHLGGRVRAFGFSGSGFAAGASPCRHAWYADRAHAAAEYARTVVVQGGLNDFDRPSPEIRAGVRALLGEVRGRRVLVVGPVPAPSRASQVERVDAILAAECARAGVPYLSMLEVRLPYLADRLHLTVQGHREFAAAVAARLAGI